MICKNCGTKYEFTPEDLKWNNLKTYCPECKYSLSAQDCREKYLKICKEKGIKIKAGFCY